MQALKAYNRHYFQTGHYLHKQAYKEGTGH